MTAFVNLSVNTKQQGIKRTVALRAVTLGHHEAGEFRLRQRISPNSFGQKQVIGSALKSQYTWHPKHAAKDDLAAFVRKVKAGANSAITNTSSTRMLISICERGYGSGS